MTINLKSTKICLFTYSHVHLYYLSSILNSGEYKANHIYEITLFSTKNIYKSNTDTSSQIEQFLSKKGIISKFKIKNFYSPGTGSSPAKKLIAYFKNFINIKFESFDIGYIPNSANPYIALCLLRIKIKRKFNIDEGNAIQSISRYLELKHSSKFYKIFKYIPNCEISPCQINFNYSTPAYVLNKQNLEKIINRYNFKKSFIELNSLLNKFFIEFSDYFNIINSNLLPKYNSEEDYIFIVTSPLTTNGYTEYKNQEVDIIDQFITKYLKSSNKKINLFLKIHYRENEEKYYYLLKKYSNILFINNKISFQSIAFIYPKYSVICFHTSAVFTLSFIKNIEKIYCLCPLIKTSSMGIILKSLISNNYKSIKYVRKINEVF